MYKRLQDYYYSSDIDQPLTFTLYEGVWDDFLQLAEAHFHFEQNPSMTFIPSPTILAPIDFYSCNNSFIDLIKDIKEGKQWYRFLIKSQTSLHTIDKHHNYTAIWRMSIFSF